MAAAYQTERPLRVTLLRKAAWRGLLVPSCKCSPPDLEVHQAWLRCSNALCRKPVRTLEGLSDMAKSIDDALVTALQQTEPTT